VSPTPHYLLRWGLEKKLCFHRIHNSSLELKNSQRYGIDYDLALTVGEPTRGSRLLESLRGEGDDHAQDCSTEQP